MNRQLRDFVGIIEDDEIDKEIKMKNVNMIDSKLSMTPVNHRISHEFNKHMRLN